MPSEIEQIKIIFDNIPIPLSMEWLESCIEWCKSDNLPPNYSLKQLQNMVFEQWLVSDLRETEIKSLPANLLSQKKYNLLGAYCIQVMKVIDISKPKLWQLQRIRNNVAKNTEIERDFGKRVLQVTLTDGVQEIEAMEFKPIPCLSINMAPGSKIKVTGPVVVRNGRLMLEPEHVKVLGGSVDDLIVPNAAENVLARILGLPENPNPHVIDEKILEITDVEATQTQPAGRPPLQNNNTNTGINNRPNPNPRDDNRNRPLITNHQQIPPEFEIDEDLLRELQEDFEEPPVTNPRPANAGSLQHSRVNLNPAPAPKNWERNGAGGSPDLFEDHGIDDELLHQHLDQFEVETEQVTSSAKVLQKSTVANSAKDALDDSFDDIDIDSHLDRIDFEMANLPCSTQVVNDFKKGLKSPVRKSESAPSAKLKLANLETASSSKGTENPFSIFANSKETTPNRVPIDFSIINKNSENVSNKKASHVSNFINKNAQHNVIRLEKLKNLLPDIGKGKFKIKAKFKAIKDKLIVVKGEYYLTITVADASGEIAVQVGPRLVDSFAEISAEKMESLRELSKNSVNSAKEEIFRALRNLHSKLVALDNIMEVQVAKGEKYPVLLGVVDT